MTPVPFRSLRTRLLVIQSVIVVGMTVATIAYVSVLANRAVNSQIDLDLKRSVTTIGKAQGARHRSLIVTAQVVATSPQIKSVLATADAVTIRDSLVESRQQNGLAELLIAIDGSGKVLARTDVSAPLAIPQLQERWLAPTLNGTPGQGEFEINGRAYEGAVAVAEAGGTIYGFVLAALPIDDAWASELRDASDKEVVILSPGRVAGSTIAIDRLPWRSVTDLPASTDAGLGNVDLGGERFQAVTMPVAPGAQSRVLSLQSRDLAFAPYRRIQIGLLALGVVAAALGIAGSAVFARSLTAPIGQLVTATERVAGGHYDAPLTLARTDELGDLARAFHAMTAGLRERADMQRFVSHSTVEMIQRQTSPGPREGERQRITLLFCDIRGFTAFSERRPPEESVRVLNRYLHLQADLVKRFSGDVDKFIGDAVFAHFSGPDMALNAIRCAIEIQRSVSQASAADPQLPALAVGIGIATGDVIVGSIGSHDRQDYTAIGAAVNLSARLCSAAEPHDILISEDTFALVRDLVAAEPMPPLAVKGFSEPVRVYRMTPKVS